MPEFEFEGRKPRVDPAAYVAPTATLIGDVRVQSGASVWFGAVLRGDGSWIEIGEGSNVQDNAVVHCSTGQPTLIGRQASVGHLACLDGCVVEDGALVGTGAIMLQGSRLGQGALLAAGSLLMEGQEIPARHLAAGVPARVKGELKETSARRLEGTAHHYQERITAYRNGLGSEAAARLGESVSSSRARGEGPPATA